MCNNTTILICKIISILKKIEIINNLETFNY